VAELIASELVGNSLQYSDGPVQLWMRREAEGIRIAVTDHSPEKPEFADLGEESEGGRGLYLVSSLAADWGYHLVGEELLGIAGKLVWADLPVPVAASGCA
jgi:anti-sigma regulatory factor (Ser/Thr protein kinase)